MNNSDLQKIFTELKDLIDEIYGTFPKIKLNDMKKQIYGVIPDASEEEMRAILKNEYELKKIEKSKRISLQYSYLIDDKEGDILSKQQLYKERQKDLELHSQAIKQKITKIKPNLSKIFQMEFRELITESSKSVQAELFDVISQIAEYGADIVEQYQNNKFFVQFQQSGLLKRIEEILLIEIQINQNNKDNTNYEKQLFRMYSFINKSIVIDEQYYTYLSFFFKDAFTDLYSNLKKESTKDKTKIMHDGIADIKAFTCISEQNVIQREFVGVLSMCQYIWPYFHINCPSELNCNNCITLPISQITQEFQRYVFKMLSIYIQYDEIYYHIPTAMQHLTLLILSQSQTLHNQIIQSIDNNNIIIPSNRTEFVPSYESVVGQTEQSIQISQLHLLQDTLQLFKELLKKDFTKYQQVLYNNNLIVALLDLTHFQRKSTPIEDLNKISGDIRTMSNIILNSIRLNINEAGQIRTIKELNIIQFEGQIIGISGGGTEQYNKSISVSLLYIENIIRFYIHGREKYHQPLPSLLKEVFDQFEEEGINEEIDSNQFHKQILRSDDIQFRAKRLMQYQLNMCK